MNDYINFKEKDITDVGDRTKALNRADKLFIGFLALLMLVIYIITDVCFEMYTQNVDEGVYLFCGIITFVAVNYFCFKLIGFKKIMAYVNIIMGTLFLTVMLAISFHKMSLLYYALSGHVQTRHVNIKRVEKVMSKRSFTGSNIIIEYDNKVVKLESSRINYYALKSAQNMVADIGKAGANNYYITKVYWRGNQKSAARQQYWATWLNNTLYVVGIFAGVLLLAALSVYIRGKIEITKPNFFARLSSWQIILLIMGVIFAVMMLAFVVLYIYMLLTYGR